MKCVVKDFYYLIGQKRVDREDPFQLDMGAFNLVLLVAEFKKTIEANAGEKSLGADLFGSLILHPQIFFETLRNCSSQQDYSERSYELRIRKIENDLFILG